MQPGRWIRFLVGVAPVRQEAIDCRQGAGPRRLAPLSAGRLRTVPTDRLAAILAHLPERSPVDSGTSRLCQISVEVSGTSGAGIMLLSDDLPRGSLYTTDTVSDFIDDLQYTLGEGPSIDAHSTGRAVIEPQLTSPSMHRWPALTPPVVDAGVQALFGFPVRIGAVRLGALHLYRTTSGPLANDQYRDLVIVADILARAILSMQAGPPGEPLAVELRNGANFHFVVHQAAGMVAVQLAVSVTEAMIRLRARAFRTERSIDDVADDVVGRRIRFSTSDRP